MDHVFIEQLSVYGKHGVHDREREVEQEFLIDIDAQFDSRKASDSDLLADTVDYGQFRAIAKDLVEGESFYLIERLADQIAERILADARIQTVAVTVRKPSVFTDAKAGVRITRSRRENSSS